ncbi:MAG: hypothetical protein RH982_15950 [Parvibaculum sp.]
MKTKPVLSASLSDIRDDTIVLTGSMSLVATALFSGSGELMRFLQSNIPATASAVDNRYRQWVFVLSKVELMRVAQRVALERADADDMPGALVFPRRLPSWRAHLRGDRAYLMPLELMPFLLDALKDHDHLTMIKDPSLRFDMRIPWEVTIERGEELRAVWRDSYAQTARTIRLTRDGPDWRVTRDESADNCPVDCREAGPESWLGPLLTTDPSRPLR